MQTLQSWTTLNVTKKNKMKSKTWKPKSVKTWRYTSWGNMEEVDTTEDQVYGILLNDLMVLIHTM